MNLNVSLKDFFKQLQIDIFEVKQDLYVMNDKSFAERGIDIGKSKYEGFLLYYFEVKENLKRAEIVKLTRKYNRESFGNPALLFIKYDNGSKISLALSERTNYIQEYRDGEKIGKVIILRDIDTNKPHPGHSRILEDLAEIKSKNFSELHNEWLKVLNINVLNDEFYDKIEQWYKKAQDKVKFPNDDNETNLIRLLTRIIFVWFIKEKNLVPKKLFDKDYLVNIIKDFCKDETSKNYYNAILQNLFFGTLNQKMNQREFIKECDFETNRKQYDINNIYRYQKMFLIPENEVINLFKDIPFLNGGLFDCLDRKPNYIDGFSRNPQKQAKIPDELFFGEQGLITIFNNYKFTITENTPQEIDVALDPELLGTVFERLLGVYREETGSVYTPREIVDHMVNESLDFYLKENIGENYESLNDKEKTIHTINNIKILDPACGSGAFPMGILHKMVDILQKLDPDNKIWRAIQEEKYGQLAKEAIKTENQKEREEKLKEISDIFDDNVSDYGRKLYLIENCIFGIDIQPIAVQISKLRFFLSLVIEQEIDKNKENLGIRALPNLETKFICADTLVGLDKPNDTKLEMDKDIKEKLIKIENNAHKYFSANTRHAKIKLQKEEENLYEELGNLFMKNGWSKEITKKIKSFNRFDQNTKTEWFDSELMFGVKDGFDIVIGNPPYVESRSSKLSKEMKNIYQKQVKLDHNKDMSKYITRGADLLVYFFPRTHTFLSDNGIGCLIVENAWLNTDYGIKASNFLLNKFQYICVTDSPFKHFNLNANINTVINLFRKKSEDKKVIFNLMEKENGKPMTKLIAEYKLSDDLLTKSKWGSILCSNSKILEIFDNIKAKGYNSDLDQSFYKIGQGINEKNVYIKTEFFEKIQNKKNIINAIFKEDKFVYDEFHYFLYHSFEKCKDDIEFLKSEKYNEFKKGKQIKRKFPKIIMPRGISYKHYAGLVQKDAFSYSRVEIYLNTENIGKKLNVWLFCNSSLFFLYREISGRKNLGGGLLKSEASDIKSIPLYFPIANEEKIRNIMKDIGEIVNLKDRLTTTVQKEIDKLVFEYFSISEYENLIISELIKLFEFRCNKAKSKKV